MGLPILVYQIQRSLLFNNCFKKIHAIKACFISFRFPQDTLTFITMCYDLSLTCDGSSNSVELKTQDNVKPIKSQCQPLLAA